MSEEATPEPTPAPTPPPRPQPLQRLGSGRQYRIQSGDSLASIAYTQLGSESNFRDIAAANDLDIFEPLPTGRVIALPQVPAVATATTPAAPTLGGLKQPETGNPYQLISWIL